MNPLENAKSPFRVCSSVGILILSVLDSITHPHAMSVAIRFAAAKKSNNIWLHPWWVVWNWTRHAPFYQWKEHKPATSQ